IQEGRARRGRPIDGPRAGQAGRAHRRRGQRGRIRRTRARRRRALSRRGRTMFDFSLGEMLVVAVVALVVLGPERLPKAARFAGLWVRRARAQWYSVKDELERELAGEELRRSMREAGEA